MSSTVWLIRGLGSIKQAVSFMKISGFLKNRELVLGVLIVSLFALVAIAAPILETPTGKDPYEIPQFGLAGDPEPPSPEHPLGLMQDKHDTLYGLIWGTRVAFRVGLIITIGRVLIGVVLGLLSGYYGGALDVVLMRLTDAFLAFPAIAATMLLLSATVDYWGIRLGEGDRAIVISLILFGWMQYSRLVRGNVLAERTKEYVTAARSIGVGSPRIIFRHILPNASNGLLVLIASDIGAMVVIVAALTFLGLAGDADIADWGMMLKHSRNWVIGAPSNAFQYWYSYIPPILAIVFFSIGWNLIGDGLRDYFDPRMRGVRS